MRVRNVNPKRQSNKTPKNKILPIAVIIALLLFLLAGIAINAEIKGLYDQLDEQQKLLDESIAKTVTAYMETKYLDSGNEKNSTEGEITGSGLTEDEIASLKDVILPLIQEYLTDDVYNGVSELMVDDLRNAIASAVQTRLLEMGISSDTLTDEITLLVMRGIQTNLTEYANNISTNAENISNISKSISGVETNISNLESSISSLQTSYESQIAALKETDSTLAARIDAILGSNSTTAAEYEQQIAALVSSLSELKNTLNEQSTTATNNYDNLTTQIDSTNNTITTPASELQQKIDQLQSILNAYINGGSLTGEIKTRTDGGSGQQLILYMPDGSSGN